MLDPKMCLMCVVKHLMIFENHTRYWSVAMIIAPLGPSLRRIHTHTRRTCAAASKRCATSIAERKSSASLDAIATAWSPAVCACEAEVEDEAAAEPVRVEASRTSRGHGRGPNASCATLWKRAATSTVGGHARSGTNACSHAKAALAPLLGWRGEGKSKEMVGWSDAKKESDERDRRVLRDNVYAFSCKHAKICLILKQNLSLFIQ